MKRSAARKRIKTWTAEPASTEEWAQGCVFLMSDLRWSCTLQVILCYNITKPCCLLLHRGSSRDGSDPGPDLGPVLCVSMAEEPALRWSRTLVPEWHQHPAGLEPAMQCFHYCRPRRGNLWPRFPPPLCFLFHRLIALLTMSSIKAFWQLL